MPANDLIKKFTDILFDAYSDNMEMVGLKSTLFVENDQLNRFNSIVVRQNKRWAVMENLIRKMLAKQIDEAKIGEIYIAWTKMWLKMAVRDYENKIDILKTEEATPHNIELIKKIEKHIEDENSGCYLPEFQPGYFDEMLCVRKLHLKLICDNLETRKFKKEDVENTAPDDVCAICCEEKKLNEKIAVFSCGHQLHLKCAKLFIETNPKCCICRQYWYVDLDIES